MVATGETSDPQTEDHEVEISHHARTRFRQRARGPDDVTVADAWREGNRLDVYGLDADEVRFHDPSRTILIRHNQTVTTVWAITHVHRAIQDAADWPGGDRA